MYKNIMHVFAKYSSPQCRISNSSSQTKIVTFCRPSGLVPFFYVTVLYWPFSPPCHLFSCQHGEATVQCIHGNQSMFDVAGFSAQSCLPTPSINHFHFLFPQPQHQGRLSVNALCFCALWTHELLALQYGRLSVMISAMIEEWHVR